MFSRKQSKFALALLAFLFTFSGNLMASSDKKVVIGVVVPAAPKVVYKIWQPVADHISQLTSFETEIKVIKGFDKLKQAIKKGQVDLFYVDAYTYYLLNKKQLTKPIAQVENTKGSILTRSAVFVHTKSGIESLQELKKKKVAYLNPYSLGGYVAPRALLYKNGILDKNGVKEEFTKNLSSVVHKTILGDVSAGSICHIKLRMMSRKIQTGDLKTIALTDEYPENVVGARKNLPKLLTEKLTEIFLTLNTNESGKKIIGGMAPMKIKRFVPYDSIAIDVVRKLVTDAQL